MKRNLIFLLLVILVLAFCNSLWAQCPEDPTDLGYCDTLHVEPWLHTDTCFAGICINEEGEDFPCFLFVSLFVTHDSNTFWWEGGQRWVQDSISSIVIPLAFWNEEGGGKVIFPTWSWLNNTKQDPGHGLFPKSIFRHIVDEDGDSVFNRFAQMVGPPEYLDPWTVMMEYDTLASDGDSGWVGLNATAAGVRRWWEGHETGTDTGKTLLATYTFTVHPQAKGDTVEVCFDSTYWLPESELAFTRYDAVNYFPRDNMPICVKVYDDTVVTGVRWIEGSTEEESKPTSFLLSQNYPNPFNPVTNFKFALPQASHVKIEIFNILGQRVKALLDEDMRAGVFVVDWDGKDEREVEVSSGIYFYRIIAGDFSDIKKMVLLR